MVPRKVWRPIRQPISRSNGAANGVPSNDASTGAATDSYTPLTISLSHTYIDHSGLISGLYVPMTTFLSSRHGRGRTDRGDKAHDRGRREHGGCAEALVQEEQHRGEDAQARERQVARNQHPQPVDHGTLEVQTCRGGEDDGVVEVADLGAVGEGERR